MSARDADDPRFRAHWLGISLEAAGKIKQPANAFAVPKHACDDPSHKSLGDCLTALWYHDRHRRTTDGRCQLCHAMRLTIRMRRGAGGEAFTEFDRWIRANADFVCRAVDARHLVCFVTNYATHGGGAEKAAAGAALWMNMVEKISVSTPARTSCVPKREGWPVSDGRFVRERSFAHPATNFTMFNWNGGDAMVRTVHLLHESMSEAPLVRRLTMAVLAWAVLYDATNPGLMLRFGRDKAWAARVIDGYWKPPRAGGGEEENVGL